MSEEEITALLAWLRGHHDPDETVPGRWRWITLQLLKNLDERLRALESGHDCAKELGL